MVTDKSMSQVEGGKEGGWPAVTIKGVGSMGRFTIQGKCNNLGEGKRKEPKKGVSCIRDVFLHPLQGKLLIHERPIPSVVVSHQKTQSTKSVVGGH
jgi:hypothetical protein